jgi:hypothetical protein
MGQLLKDGEMRAGTIGLAAGYRGQRPAGHSL